MRNLAGNLKKTLPAVVSLLLTVGTGTLFSACGVKEDGTWMRCRSAQESILVLSAALGVLLLLKAVIKGKWVRRILDAAGAAGGIILFLLPGNLMPLCMMKTMRCHTAMQPFVRIMAVLITILCLLDLFIALKGKKDR